MSYEGNRDDAARLQHAGKVMTRYGGPPFGGRLFICAIGRLVALLQLAAVIR